MKEKIYSHNCNETKKNFGGLSSPKFYTKCPDCGERLILVENGDRLTDKEWIEFFLKLMEDFGD